MNAKKKGGEPTEVFFNYERLGSFCYSCGIMSHVDEFCDHFFAMPMDDGTRHWSSELYTMITEESAVKYLHGGRHGPSVAVTKTKTIATINAIMRMGNRQQMASLSYWKEKRSRFLHS
ncbi:hypothetical protein JHK82_053139 [Glycine max]|nr:hypothetical protein JHK86_052987 [Glycine max]KAG5085742.1 hypothetical protein JHK82_053139 [Glycine max]